MAEWAAEVSAKPYGARIYSITRVVAEQTLFRIHHVRTAGIQILQTSPPVIIAPVHRSNLANLTVTPPLNLDLDFSFDVRAFVRDAGGDTQANLQTINVGVNPINDAPMVTSTSSSTGEDTNLTITLTASEVDTFAHSAMNAAIAGSDSAACVASGCSGATAM